MQTAKDFTEFYNSELKSLIVQHEKERKNVAIFGILGPISIVSAFICFFLGANSDTQNIIIIAIPLFIAGVILLILFYNKKKKYVSWFKEDIIHNIIRFIDPNLRYNPAGCIYGRDYKNSGLYLEEADRFRGDDYVEGLRDKTVFCFSELHTEKEVSNGKSTSWQTIFKGLFFIGDFNKNFNGRTYVYSENHPQLGFFSKMFSSFAWDLKKVILESVEFENKFVVYSNDQVEARYILTPSFMERLVKLQDLMGENTSYSFVNTNVYVAVPIDEDLFEPSIFGTNDYGEMDRYYNTVIIVFEIIDELNLNLRIWNKE